MTTRRRQVVAGVATAAAIALGMAPIVDARPAQEDDPTAPDRLTLVSQSPWVAPEGTFELVVAIDGLEEGDTVTVSVRDRVRNRTQFLTTLDGEGVRSERLAPEVTIEGDQVTVEVAGADLPREGVYPVVVNLDDADGELADRLVTHLLRLKSPDPAAVPLGVAVVVPVHAEPAHVEPGVVDAGALADARTTIGALAEHADLPVTVVPTPETLDALRTTDDDAVSALASAVQSSQVVGGPWVRIDPGSWERAGRSTAALDRAGAAALQGTLGEAVDGSTWVAPVEVSRPSVAAAVEAGADNVIVDSDDLEPLDVEDFPKTLTRPFELALEDDIDGAMVTALAADAALAAHHAETDDPVLAAHWTLADLAVLAVDDPSERRVAVLRLDEDAATDADFLGRLLDGLEPPEPITPPAQPVEPPPSTDTTEPGATTTTTAPPAPIVPSPLVVAEPVSTAFDAVTPAGADGGADEDDPLVRVLLDDGPAPSLGSMPAPLREAEDRLASYRTVFGPADPTAAAVDVVLLTAASADVDDDERGAMIGRGDDALDANLAGITGPPNQRVTLTDRTGVVQLVFGNATDRPADVTLHVRSDRLELPGEPDGDIPIRLDGPTTRFDLHLRARTSGDAPLDLVVTSPDGRILFGESRIRVRTTAFSGVGLLLMGTAAGFLVLWWSRTILRERRAKRRAPAHARPS